MLPLFLEIKMEWGKHTLANLQKLAFCHTLIESFNRDFIKDYTGLNSDRALGVVVNLKDGRTFRIKFIETREIVPHESKPGMTQQLTYFVVEPSYQDTLNELLQILQPLPEQTDWNLRKIKFVLGEINSWSKDPSTKVSAAIFNGKYPICSSYNGFPPGVEDTPERLNDRPLKYKIVQHAEANAISTCARLGIKTEGMSMAVSLFPCTTCAGMIISAGIKEIITVEPSDEVKSRWGEDFELSKKLLSEAGVELKFVSLD